jgi:hypothetical protein
MLITPTSSQTIRSMKGWMAMLINAATNIDANL